MPAKILFIEDNELNRDMLSRRLQRKGYSVVMAIDGIEGIARAKSELPDIILMDMSLPELDGWQAAKRLKSDNLTKHIPIIALTAHAVAGDRAKCLLAGCDDYDTKPVNFTALVTKIQTQLNNNTNKNGNQ